MELKNNYKVTIANLKLLGATKKKSDWCGINGIFFDRDGTVYATDGHVMGMSNSLSTGPIGLLLKSSESIKFGRLTENSVCSLVRIADSNSYNVISTETRKAIGLVTLEPFDGFPDCNLIFKTILSKAPVATITLDAVLLDKIASAICSEHQKSLPITLEIYDDMTVIPVKNHLSDRYAGAIMPMRRPNT